MRKMLAFLVIIVTTHLSNECFAQDGKKPFSFGFGFEGGPVVGNKNIKDIYTSEFGMYLRFSFQAGPGYVTFAPGAHLVFPKNLTSDDDLKIGTHVPYKLGYKYIINDKFFVMGEAGYARYRFYTLSSEGDEIEKIKNGGFCFSPSVGLNLKKFELGLKYENTIINDKNAEYNVGLLALRAGFNF